MMRPDPDRVRGVTPRGAEAWIPPLLLGIGSLVLVVSLGWFIVIAWGMRGRSSLPPYMIPIGVVVAAGVAAHLFIRGLQNLRSAWRGRRARTDPPGRT